MNGHDQDGPDTQTLPPEGIPPKVGGEMISSQPSPSRSGAKNAFKTVVVLGVGFGLGALLFGGQSSGPAGHSHPTTVEAETAAAPAVWTCSMHPQVRQPEPGLCPLCAMDLIELSSLAGADLPPNRVALSERARALARIRTTEVRRAPSAGVEVFLSGRVEPDETTLRTVTAWTAGRIDKLNVRATGETVTANQVVASIYSAELFAAQQDLIVAARQATRLATGNDLARQTAEAGLNAARERLRLLGASAAEIKRVETSGAPSRLTPVRTPAAGTVIERIAAEGAWVEAGGPLLRIADLSRVWVMLDAYERDLGRLAVGQRVVITVEALAGETFAGEIAFIDPTVDRERRTAKVRVVVDNTDGRLRPGLAVQASVDGVALIAAPLVIPASAPLFTGRRSVVYVEINTSDGPVHEARVVRLGQRLTEGYPVIAGLEEGERVVTRGAFLLDADLQLRGGESMMTLEDDREIDPESEPLVLNANDRRALAPVFEGYLNVQRALAADDIGLAREAARALATLAPSLRFSEAPTLEGAWAPLRERIATEAARVADAASLESARGPFEPLSLTLERVLVRFGNPLDKPIGVAFCPMARDGSGARWLQGEGDVDNAYYGAVMRKCGEIRALVPSEAFLVPQKNGGSAK